VVVGCLLIGWIAIRLRRIDAGREEAVENLRRTRDELEMRVQARTAALVTANQQLEAEISERKRAAARFSALLESAPDPMVIVDQSGHIVLVNSQTESIFGYNRDALIGEPVEILIPEASRNRHPEHRAEYASAPRVREMGIGLELYALRKDGSQFPVEISLSPIETEQGILVASAIRDISERKEAQEALRQSNVIFRQLAGHINQAIWLRNAIDDTMIYMSPAYQTITGQTVESVFESYDALLKIMHPEDLDRVKQARKLHPKESFETEYRIIRTDGSIRWIRACNFPIFDNNGSVTRIAGVSEDITIRKEAEARQLELQVERERVELLKHFLSGASHDFRTPLTVMSTSLYLLTKAKDVETQRRELDKLSDQVHRLQRLVESLFTLSRLDVNSADEFEFERCDLNALVQMVCEEQRPLIAHKHSHLGLRLADNLSPIFADKIEISLAIYHILVNAINYSPEEGEIIICTRQQDDNSVLLKIQDTGIGIGDSDLSHIFERFYRADRARNINNGGLGLGLSIAQRIVEGHHGSITVQSTLGKGSTFSLILPAYLQPDFVGSSSSL
jgi:PAS domain S-box-containing protein